MKTLYTPEIATLKKVISQTALESLFVVELSERKTLGHKPGQFVQLSIFGVGEAPISISSEPMPKKPTFEICVRKVGNVTNALLGLKAGAKIGVRGPFGNGFDLEKFKGQDIIIVAGGIGLVPLRSLIREMLSHRKEYGKIFILYGCKTPNEILFKTELISWGSLKEVELQTTVDFSDGEWIGNVGVITSLIPMIEFDPARTQAVIVGPPIMYRFVIKELKARRLADENIWLSLERKMKCGVGKCGHCQMNNIYVCQEGPVFNYAELKHIPESV